MDQAGRGIALASSGANGLEVCPDCQSCHPRRRNSSGASRGERPRFARPPGGADPVDRRTPLGGLHHTVCESDRISPAVRARKVFAAAEDRIPPALLKRLIRELKGLIPRWKWISSARELPRSPAKLGDELFYAITALPMSRLEIWRAGYPDCVAVLDEAYSLLYAIGISMREKKHRSEGRRTG